ncbi:MAG: hypothetical protein ABR575_08450 [Actinomycetota bacterium]
MASGVGRALAVTALALVALAGCAGKESGGASEPVDCGLPTPERGLDASVVPRLFVEPVKGEVVQAETGRRGRGFVAAVNVPLSVSDTFDAYRRAAARVGYREVFVDNERFEAEITLEKGTDLVAIQIRRSICDDRSVAFVNEVVR